MDEMSRCGERRALNARERSGDATSGDERRRDERRRDGEASPAAASPSARVLLAQRALARGRSCCRLTDLPVSGTHAASEPLPATCCAGGERSYGAPVRRSPEWGRGARVLPLVVHQNYTDPPLGCPRPLHLPFLVMSVTQVEFPGQRNINGGEELGCSRWSFTRII